MACLAFDFPPRFLAKSAEEALLFQLFLRRRKTKFKLFLGVVLSQIHRNFIAEWRDENRWKHSLTGRSECMFATSIPECVSFDYCSWYLLAETSHCAVRGIICMWLAFTAASVCRRRRRLRPWTAQDVWNLAHACTALAIQKFWQLCMIFL